jgi:hypothetical protein
LQQPTPQPALQKHRRRGGRPANDQKPHLRVADGPNETLAGLKRQSAPKCARRVPHAGAAGTVRCIRETIRGVQHDLDAFRCFLFSGFPSPALLITIVIASEFLCAAAGAVAAGYIANLCVRWYACQLGFSCPAARNSQPWARSAASRWETGQDDPAWAAQ